MSRRESFAAVLRPVDNDVGSSRVVFNVQHREGISGLLIERWKYQGMLVGMTEHECRSL